MLRISGSTWSRDKLQATEKEVKHPPREPFSNVVSRIRYIQC
jgi:hypothetical protein